MPEAGNQKLIITHAVLTGLTPLIPVPIVDDLVKSYFQRRLVREVPDLAARTQALGMGFRDNIIGSGSDDAVDVLDRRVEFRIQACVAQAASR